MEGNINTAEVKGMTENTEKEGQKKRKNKWEVRTITRRKWREENNEEKKNERNVNNDRKWIKEEEERKETKEKGEEY